MARAVPLMNAPRIESYAATLIRPGGRIELAEFILEYDPPLVRLSLRRWGGTISRCAKDFFDALGEIRPELEKEGILVHCYGGSRNVYPTTMQRTAGLGKQAYKLAAGKPREEVVAIFDYGRDLDPCPVREQLEFYQSWCAGWKVPPAPRTGGDAVS